MKIKTKYNVTNKVLFMHEGVEKLSTINSISIDVNHNNEIKIVYYLDYQPFNSFRVEEKDIIELV